MYFFIKLFFTSLLALLPLSVTLSCSKATQEESQPLSSRFITGVIIPIGSEFSPNSEYLILGKGFEQGDKVFFEQDTHKIEAKVVGVTATGITIIIPALLKEGAQYKIVVYRNQNSQILGTTIVSIKIIANLVIPGEIRGACGDEISIFGNGFAEDDTIIFVQHTEVEAVTTHVSTSGITISLPQEVDNGSVTLKLKRAGTAYHLGESTLLLTFSLTVADKSGATIKGVVYSGGRPLVGVSVSDGDLITQTDANGHYWLNSAKRNNLAFVILPSGFEAIITEGLPQFWAHCTQGATVSEQINFALSPKENDRHTVVAFTDAHLANRNSPLDYVQFRNGIFNELKETYNNDNRVIGLNLGDFSWDLYWYSNNYALKEAKKELATLTFPVFSAMGNHDNDPYMANDFEGENSWRNIMGPVYYSMNIGQVHYIMLDNILWTNTGGSQGTVGSRNYATGVDGYQLEWLKKDLALVDAHTPVIVGFHIPVITYGGVNGGQYVKNSVVAGMSSVMTELRKFNTVHILTGHSHDNRNITIDYQQGAFERREHNIVAASGTWWWTNRYTPPNNVNIAPDGTPSGYKVFEVEGKNIKWHYKAVGQPREKQFMAFDMNEVKRYWTTNTDAIRAFAYTDFSERANDYNHIGENEVLINVWAFEQDFWKISVKEGNTELLVEAIWGTRCPLHTISYEIPRRAAGSAPTSSFISTLNVTHFYRVKTSSATSTLEITIEDRFGNLYKETMRRPKPLTTKIE